MSKPVRLSEICACRNGHMTVTVVPTGARVILSGDVSNWPFEFPNFKED